MKPLEGAEELVRIGHVEPGAVVFHEKRGITSCVSYPEFYHSAGGLFTKFPCIAKKVFQSHGKEPFVAQGRETARNDEFRLPFRVVGPEPRGDVGRKGAQVHLFAVHRAEACEPFMFERRVQGVERGGRGLLEVQLLGQQFDIRRGNVRHADLQVEIRRGVADDAGIDAGPGEFAAETAVAGVIGSSVAAVSFPSFSLLHSKGDIETIRKQCTIASEEVLVLNSHERPIVILPHRSD